MEVPLIYSCWGCAMFELPGRLDGVLRRHGSMLPNGAEDEIPLIMRDLEKIISIIHRHSSDPNLEDQAMVVSCWMKGVRELSYDIEDCIDQYEHAAAGSNIPRRQINRRRWSRSWSRSKKTPRLPERLKQRLWMANKIREFSLRAQEALQSYSMYRYNNLPRIATPSTHISDVSSSSSTPSGKRANNVLVGIDAAMGKLEGWLTDGEDKLKVVSIVGVGGVGKTTLANELYRKLGRRFECRAFVRSSQKPDMRRLLISILSQVRPHQPPDNWQVHSLISSISTHLQDKRYLIIINDLWATSTWDIIKCALPYGNSCSRIVTTTEIEDLALQSCGYDSRYIFKLKPLGADDSRNLFFSTVFGIHDMCRPELSEVSYDIIRKCGGLPLAIVTIASLLASQLEKQEQWDYINKSLGYSLMTNPTFERMDQILNLIYNNLPQHLKACMLYLSMYEEDYIIWKDDLVNQWMAEGFIFATGGHDKEEISGAYFDELVGRKIIQPVHINDNGEVLSCVVHRMVLNFITYKSIGENFIIAIDHSQTTARYADKVRRLSIHFGNIEDATPPTNMRLSQVRTLALLRVSKCMPFIMEFRLLKVLILHFWGDEGSISCDLTKISELFRLRFLKVTSNVTLKLRTQMQGLQYLETLKIDGKIDEVPSDIIHLPGLLHLSLPAKTDLPNGIFHMTSLRTLGYFDLSCNSIGNLLSIGELTNLRDLQLTYSTLQTNNLEDKFQCLGLILQKLSNLKSITLLHAGSSCASSLDDSTATNVSISGEGLSSMSSPPALLERLELSPRICIFSYLHEWIGQLSKLCTLKIGVRELVRYDIDVLRKLPALVALSLHVYTKPAQMIVFGTAGFSALKYFKFNCCVAWLRFNRGAMPNLQKLKLGYNINRVDQGRVIPIGMEHLSSLIQVSVKVGGADPKKYDTRAEELAFRLSIGSNVRSPSITFQCVTQMFDCKEDLVVKSRREYGKLKQVKQHEILKEDSVVSDKLDEIMQDSVQESNKHADSRSTLSELDILLLLRNKLDMQRNDTARGIPIFRVYCVDPWQLAEIGAGEGEPWFFFCPQVRKVTIQRTPSGYWKAQEGRFIYSADGFPVGMKTAMVFYHGSLPSGTKTGWEMDEFLANPSDGGHIISFGQLRRGMSLCRLYTTKSTTAPSPLCAEDSSSDNPTGLLLKGKHTALDKYDEGEIEQEIIENVTDEKGANKQPNKKRVMTGVCMGTWSEVAPYSDDE